MKRVQLFSDHKNEPLNRGRPSWYQLEVCHQNPAQSTALVLYVDIDSKDVIRHLYFELKPSSSSESKDWEVHLPYLSALTQIVPGRKVQDLLSMGMEIYQEFFKDDPLFQDLWNKEEVPFFSLPLQILQEGLEEYQGRPLAWEDQFRQKSENLVCVCFGIYQDQIQKLVEDNPHYQLRDITTHLKAGAGCTQCVRDIQRILLAKKYSPIPSKMPSHGDGKIQVVSPQRVSKEKFLIGQETYVEFILKLQPLIDEWVRHEYGPKNGHESKVKIELMKLNGKSFQFRISPPDCSDIYGPFQDYLRFLFRSWGIFGPAGSDFILTIVE